MNREEQQVKEIAKDIPFLSLDREVFVSADRKEWHSWMLSEEDTIAIAEALYDKGYKKLSKEAQEMVSNALVYSKRLKIEKSAEQVRKRTAKEIRDKIIANKDMPEPIKNEWKKWFNKEYGVEIEE